MAKSGIIPLLGKAGLEFSIIHVDDVTEGIIQAGFSDASNGEVFYLSDGRVHTLGEVAHILSTITGGAKIITIPCPLGKIAGRLGDWISCISGKPRLINSQKVNEVLREGWVCDTAKIKEQLGFRPSIELKTGLESTYHWYRDAGWL